VRDGLPRGDQPRAGNTVLHSYRRRGREPVRRIRAREQRVAALQRVPVAVGESGPFAGIGIRELVDRRAARVAQPDAFAAVGECTAVHRSGDHGESVGRDGCSRSEAEAGTADAPAADIHLATGGVVQFDELGRRVVVAGVVVQFVEHHYRRRRRVDARDGQEGNAREARRCRHQRNECALHCRTVAIRRGRPFGRGRRGGRVGRSGYRSAR